MPLKFTILDKPYLIILCLFKTIGSEPFTNMPILTAHSILCALMSCCSKMEDPNTEYCCNY